MSKHKKTKTKKERLWVVRCDCGNIGVASESELLSGKITGCPDCSCPEHAFHEICEDCGRIIDNK